MAGPAGNGVYPELAELVALRRPPGAVTRHPPRSCAEGVRASRQAGRGMDYADTRPYVAGDEARHVDWRVTARSGQLHSKQFHAEREQVCLLLADPQPSQFFGTRARYKSVQCARAGAAAAWWALAQGDRVALLDTSSGSLTPATAGPRGVMRSLQGLVQAYAQAPAADARPLAHWLEQAARLCRGGSLVVLTEAGRAAQVPLALWQACARHARVHLVLVNDVLELDPPARALRLVGSNGAQVLDLSQPAVREGWLAQGLRPRQALQELHVAGLQVHALQADDPSDAWLPLPLPVRGGVT